jgi:hypothetical protein
MSVKTALDLASRRPVSVHLSLAGQGTIAALRHRLARIARGQRQRLDGRQVQGLRGLGGVPIHTRASSSTPARLLDSGRPRTARHASGGGRVRRADSAAQPGWPPSTGTRATPGRRSEQGGGDASGARRVDGGEPRHRIARRLAATDIAAPPLTVTHAGPQPASVLIRAAQRGRRWCRARPW